MIDTEFSTVGPMSFDLAVLLSHCFISYVYHRMKKNAQVAEEVVETCKDLGQYSQSNTILFYT